MLVKFSLEFLLYTSGMSVVKVKSGTVGSVIQELFNRFPQLQLFLTANKEAESARTSIKLNDGYLYEVDSLYLELSDTDVMEFGRDVPEGEGGVGKIIAGVVLIAAAFILAPVTMGWSLSGYYLGAAMLGASLVLGGISELIIGQPKIPSIDGTTTSPTYSFSGIHNTTAPGTPIGIVYGTHRVGGHLLNVYTQVLFDQNNYLFTQLGVSEGEIEDISEVEINKRPAEEYLATSLYWRKGTSAQLVPDKHLTIEENASNIIELPPFRSGQTVILFNKNLIHTPYSVENLFGTPVNKIAVRCMNEYDKSSLKVGDVFMWLEDYNGIQLTDKKTFAVGGDREVIVTFDLAVDFVGNFRIKTSSRPIPSYTRNTDGGTATTYSPYYYGTFHLLSITMSDTKSAVRDIAPAMYGFNMVQNSVTYDQLITAQEDNYLSGGAWFTTQTEVDTIYLSIVAPALTANGGGATVTFKVGYRAEGSTAGYTLVKTKDTVPSEIHTIQHKTGTSSEVFKVVVVDGLPSISKWEIAVFRETKDSGGNINVVDDIYLRDVTEVTTSGHIYPHTALLGVKIKASEQLSGGLPTFTSLVKGIKVSLPVGYNGTTRLWETPWNGEMTTTKAWTDNNVWCLYDLITNKRYGLGNYFKIAPDKKVQMLANFKEMADYCDERLASSGDPLPVTTTTILGGAKVLVKPVVDIDGVSTILPIPRTRFSLNLAIDSTKSAIEWLNTICASMRATLYYTEGCVYIDIDRPKPMTQIFTMSSIAEYSQSRSSKTGVPNTYEVQFVDAAKNYEPAILEVEDPDYQTNPDMEQRSKTLGLVGVTDERQVRSLTKYTLYAGKLCRTNVSFKTGTFGLSSMVGDVIGIQHDVPRWGVGGKIVACEVIDIDTYRLTLSTEVDMALGTEYSICISTPGVAPETVEILADEGVTTVVDIQAPTFIPAKGDEFIMGLTSNTVKPFRIVSLKRDADEKIEVTAVEYVEELYPAADNIDDVGGVTNVPYKTFTPQGKISVQGVKVAQKIYLDAAGIYKTGIVLTYTVPADVQWQGATVWYGLDDYTTQLPLNRDGYVFLPEVYVPGIYKFAVASHYADGTRQTVSEAVYGGAFDSTEIALGQPLADTFLSGISGLAIENKGNDNEFLGKDCVVSWYKPLVYNPDIPAGDEVAGASTVQTNNLFSHYIVDVNNIDGSIRRSSKLTKETYTYTHEMNHEDQIARTFAISVTAVDIYGRVSEPTTIICTNPAPPAVI